MKHDIFTGSGVALVTPLNEKGIDYDAFEKLIEFQISNKTDAIIVCGTTGEASAMPDSEHLEAIKFVVDTVNKRIPVIAGTGSNDTAHGVHLSVEAEKLGVDGLLLVTPYYNKTNTKGLINHFEQTIKSVDCPIILYNVPSRTAMNISIPVLDALAKYDNVVAIKEASGNISYASQIAREFKDRYTLYSGNDDIIVPIMSLGGKGVISVLANVMPRETHDICELYLSGKVEESRDLQLKLLNLINALFIEVNPIPVKTALNLMNMNAGLLRAPLFEMEESNKAKLIKEMELCGLI